MPKEKKQKEKLPSLFKYIISKWFWISLGMFVVGIALAVVWGIIYKDITNEWVLWILQVVDVVFLFGFAIMAIFAVMSATGRRGSAFYGTPQPKVIEAN